MPVDGGDVNGGRFITLEGGEGSGKSTQLDMLGPALEQAGLDVVRTREPGGAPGAEEIRNLLVHGAPGRWDGMTEALLHFAARREHLTAIVWPVLERGAWVISDRFADSTMAYQGFGHDLGRVVIEALYDQVVGEFRPDLTVILDMEPEAGLARAAQRAGTAKGVKDDRYERMGLDFHRRLREGFLDIARREPDRCILVDAAQSPEVVSAAILDAVRDRLAPPGL